MTFNNERIQLKLGNCLDVLKDFPDGCIDAVVTDPPYGLSFMGKKWDYDVPNKEIWAECLRVLKPGGNLLCFAGTRTQHRMVARVVEAGFTLQDAVLWAYGSGFPKSHNVSKAIDKSLGVERTEVIGTKLGRPGMAKDGSNQSFDSSINTYGSGGVLSTDITAPVTDAAKQWEGWGTSLKPSFEPVSIYTKGDSLTLHSEFKRLYYCAKASKKERNLGLDKIKEITFYIEEEIEEGIWKDQVQVAQLRVDTAQLLPKVIGAYGIQSKSVQEWSMSLFGNFTTDQFHQGMTSTTKMGTSLTTTSKILSYYQNWLIKENIPGVNLERMDGGNLAGNAESGTISITITKGSTVYPLGVDRAASKMRLKISVKDARSDHPTIKPLKLMEQLCELATPRGGVILDPFMGSGTTGIAALNMGFNFVGIEMGEEYFDIAQTRIVNLHGGPNND